MASWSKQPDKDRSERTEGTGSYTAWIESHQALGHHPKTMRLAATLGVRVPEAVGLLHFLWWWALDYAADGVVAAADQATVARTCLWHGKSDRFWGALLEVGFVEPADSGSVRIHDWMDYAGRLLEKRAHNVQRARANRSRNVQSDARARSGATVPDSTGQYRVGGRVALQRARAREGDLPSLPPEVVERLARPPIPPTQLLVSSNEDDGGDGC